VTQARITVCTFAAANFFTGQASEVLGHRSNRKSRKAKLTVTKTLNQAGAVHCAACFFHGDRDLKSPSGSRDHDCSQPPPRIRTRGTTASGSSLRERRPCDAGDRDDREQALGGPGISWFPGEVSRYMHGVSDRAGLWCTSRYRRTRWGLPLLLRASASRSEFLTRLNTRPARSLANASTLPLRAAPHDSGPMWVATSHSYDFAFTTPRRFSRRTGGTTCRSSRKHPGP
jgi:hypothetical protein